MATESPSTGKLQNILLNTHSSKGLADYLKQHTIANDNLSFSAVFQDLLEKHNLKKADVIQVSNLDRTYAYQILNGSKSPSRNKILALGIAADFSVKEIRKLLECASVGILYSRSARDAVILYGIENHLGLAHINEMLFDINEAIIE
jgi:transcriptional regulator with XRE-family HTH domain